LIRTDMVIAFHARFCVPGFLSGRFVAVPFSRRCRWRR